MATYITDAAREEDWQRIRRRRRPSRFWSRALLFAASVLLVNGLIGERGLLEGVRAQHAYGAAARDLARLRQENDGLREQARRLRHDPAVIEAVARRELGLVRNGEILITVHDLR